MSLTGPKLLLVLGLPTSLPIKSFNRKPSSNLFQNYHPIHTPCEKSIFFHLFPKIHQLVTLIQSNNAYICKLTGSDDGAITIAISTVTRLSHWKNQEVSSPSVRIWYDSRYRSNPNGMCTGGREDGKNGKPYFRSFGDKYQSAQIISISFNAIDSFSVLAIMEKAWQVPLSIFYRYGFTYFEERLSSNKEARRK